jgi:flagella basal body P-ring formation protein FlgA
VRAHALIGLDPGDVREVTVTRASRAIPAHEIELAIAQALSKQYALGEPDDISVSFERDMRAIQVEPNAKGEPRVARISFDTRSGRFDASIELPTGASSRGLLRLTGRAAATIEVAVLARGVDRGALIKESDLTVERRPRADAGRDAITDIAQAIGFAARNPMQSGRPLRVSDLTKPELVQRGESVTLVYEMPGLMLTVRGKANEGGSEGDVISVLNEQTKRTLQGKIVGPGRVVISTGSPRLAANLTPSGGKH